MDEDIDVSIEVTYARSMPRQCAVIDLVTRPDGLGIPSFASDRGETRYQNGIRTLRVTETNA